MPKNIVIFSDGTGQRSGEHFEETRTNIYKLYRAARCGPDGSVDPREQFAFYDPGIGTISPKLSFLGELGAAVWNLVCQATGLGLTANIKDCYKAILKVYEPGDRIFLFGFSRGAYTVRCLASVLAFCGIPRRMTDGRPLRKDEGSLESLAHEAVEKVYQHVSWEKGEKKRDTDFAEQRQLLAKRFRDQHESADVYPHFIGVFDTVATVANLTSLLLTAGILFVVFGILALATWLCGLSWFWLCGLVVAFASFGAGWYLKKHFKVAFGLEGHPWWKTVHINSGRMRFYDQMLNLNVRFARHALAIDEHRKDFDRVPWGAVQSARPAVDGDPEWLIQRWFAGNHADIGGGYAEPESRLSDAALAWMLGEATSIPDPLLVDRTVLRVYPSATGQQHDETKSWAFRFAKSQHRPIPVDAPLDVHVVPRFQAASVLQCDEDKRYLPENLRNHQATKGFY